MEDNCKKCVDCNCDKQNTPKIVKDKYVDGGNFDTPDEEFDRKFGNEKSTFDEADLDTVLDGGSF